MTRKRGKSQRKFKNGGRNCCVEEKGNSETQATCERNSVSSPECKTVCSKSSDSNSEIGENCRIETASSTETSEVYKEQILNSKAEDSKVHHVDNVTIQTASYSSVLKSKANTTEHKQPSHQGTFPRENHNIEWDSTVTVYYKCTTRSSVSTRDSGTRNSSNVKPGRSNGFSVSVSNTDDSKHPKEGYERGNGKQILTSQDSNVFKSSQVANQGSAARGRDIGNGNKNFASPNSTGFKSPQVGNQNSAGSGRGRVRGRARGSQNFNSPSLTNDTTSAMGNSNASTGITKVTPDNQNTPYATNRESPQFAYESEAMKGCGIGRGKGHEHSNSTSPTNDKSSSIANSGDCRGVVKNQDDQGCEYPPITNQNEVRRRLGRGRALRPASKPPDKAELQKSAGTKEKVVTDSVEAKKSQRTLRSNTDAIKKKEEAVIQGVIQKLKEYLLQKVNFLSKEKPTGSINDLRLLFHSENRKTKTTKHSKGDFALVFCQISASKKVLVIGNPGFRKTTLCLEVSKVITCRNTTGKIVFYTTALEVENMDLDVAQNFNKVYSDMLGIEPELFQQLFVDFAKDIVVIFEDYDALSTVAKSKVQAFASSCRSAVIITSRFVSDTDPILKHIDTLVRIPGSEVPKLFRKNGDKKLLYICECLFADLPQPFFSHLDKSKHLPGSLFLILDQVFDLKAQELLNAQETTNMPKENIQNPEKYFLQLGCLLFDALCQGFKSFTEQCLKDILGEDGLYFIIACDILYHERGETRNRVFIPHCKLLLVFFATKYLRDLWSKTKSLEQKQHFMQNVLCLRDCTGDYLFADTETPNLYFVGLLPEIVLNFGREFNLDNATVEMYYDNQGTELSKSFSSLSLLIRIGKLHLSRFLFKELPADNEKLHEVFEAFLNVLYLPDMNVEYEMYLNEYEDRYYLRVLGRMFDAGTDIVFRSVCGSSGSGEIISSFVEISFNVLENVVEFLSDFLRQNFPDLQLSKECGELQFFDFVSNLIWGFSDCTVGPKTSVSFYRSNIGQVGMKNNSIVLCFEPSSKNRVVTASCYKLASAKCTVEKSSSKKEDLLKLINSLKCDFEELYDNCKDVKIAIEMIKN